MTPLSEIGAPAMKVIVQIPCYNEERQLAATVAEIPRHIEGVQRVEILVIDDGSSDRTAAVAVAAGVDHVIRHIRNQGLASAFRTGLEESLRLGADIVVNTDADNQYPGDQIPQLIRPILDGTADLVVGDRQTRSLRHFSPTKRIFQRLGSRVVKRLSATPVPDAVSGFRALSRAAASEINIISSFSYTIEMLIQAGKKGLAVQFVPIRVNPGNRRSRLFTSVPQFIARSIATMIRTYALYQPFRLFFGLGCALVFIGVVPVSRFLYFFFAGRGGGHVQSLILGAALLVMGFVTLIFGILADLVASNRRLLEMVLKLQRQATSEPKHDPETG